MKKKNSHIRHIMFSPSWGIRKYMHYYGVTRPVFLQAFEEQYGISFTDMRIKMLIPIYIEKVCNGGMLVNDFNKKYNSRNLKLSQYVFDGNKKPIKSKKEDCIRMRAMGYSREEIAIELNVNIQYVTDVTGRQTSARRDYVRKHANELAEQGLSYSEIADRLNVSHNTIVNILWRNHDHIREDKVELVKELLFSGEKVSTIIEKTGLTVREYRAIISKYDLQKVRMQTWWKQQTEVTMNKIRPLIMAGHTVKEVSELSGVSQQHVRHVTLKYGDPEMVQKYKENKIKN